MRQQEDVAEMQRGKQRGEGGSRQTENEQTYIMNLSRLKSAENVQFPSEMTIAHEQHDNLYILYLE